MNIWHDVLKKRGFCERHKMIPEINGIHSIEESKSRLILFFRTFMATLLRFPF